MPPPFRVKMAYSIHAMCARQNLPKQRSWWHAYASRRYTNKHTAKWQCIQNAVWLCCAALPVNICAAHGTVNVFLLRDRKGSSRQVSFEVVKSSKWSANIQIVLPKEEGKGRGLIKDKCTPEADKLFFKCVNTGWPESCGLCSDKTVHKDDEQITNSKNEGVMEEHDDMSTSPDYVYHHQEESAVLGDDPALWLKVIYSEK